MQTTWLVSLHRHYAEEILRGTKKFEYRRVRMSCKSGDRVLVYATHPDKLVLGEFTVGENSLYGVTPDTALNAANPYERPALHEYFMYPTPARAVTALEVVRPILYPEGQRLFAMCGLKRGPHSYRRAEVIAEPLR